MNIFVFNLDPVLNAQDHCDKHVVKMISEQTQIMSTAHRYLDGTFTIEEIDGKLVSRYVLPDSRDDLLCEATHVNHPAVCWARESAKNYLWLLESTMCIMYEYTHRYGRIHQYENLLVYLRSLPDKILGGPSTSFAQCMPVEYKTYMVTDAYRRYFCGAKRHIAKWTKRSVPDWYK